MGATDRQQDFATAATSDLWEEASAVIPGGTSTNAKRLPLELADDMPGFIDHADGCRITDVRGREFIDYGASLGPIILGHNHPAVNDAVRAQLDKGVVFSMTTPLELEAARAVQDIVPGAEMVRFSQDGRRRGKRLRSRRAGLHRPGPHRRHRISRLARRPCLVPARRFGRGQRWRAGSRPGTHPAVPARRYRGADEDIRRPPGRRRSSSSPAIRLGSR